MLEYGNSAARACSSLSIRTRRHCEYVTSQGEMVIRNNILGSLLKEIYVSKLIMIYYVSFES